MSAKSFEKIAKLAETQAAMIGGMDKAGLFEYRGLLVRGIADMQKMIDPLVYSQNKLKALLSKVEERMKKI